MQNKINLNSFSFKISFQAVRQNCLHGRQIAFVSPNVCLEIQIFEEFSFTVREKKEEGKRKHGRMRILLRRSLPLNALEKRHMKCECIRGKKKKKKSEFASEIHLQKKLGIPFGEISTTESSWYTNDPLVHGK